MRGPPSLLQPCLGPEGGGTPLKGPFFALLLCLTQTYALDHNLLFEPLTAMPMGCVNLNFTNATLNACGYCVGGSTGLPADYGRDCAGVCHGLSSKDCNQQCGGSAYYDDCTNECIGGTTGTTEVDKKGNRDCRGVCRKDADQEYELDACGVCRLKERDKRSLFRDCAEQCYTPGTSGKMGRMLCGQCVGGTTQVNETDVLDECGQCKNEPHSTECSGCRLEEKDECNVCHGNGTSCLKIIGVSPKVLPSKDGKRKKVKKYQNVSFVKKKKGKQKPRRPPPNKVTLKGAFLGQRENISCFFLPIDNPEQNRTNVRATNDTSPGCKVSLSAGHYQVGVKLFRGEGGPIEEVTNHILVVYDHHVMYDSMSPVEAPYYDITKTTKHIVLTFLGNKTENLPLICVVTGKAWPKSKIHVSGSPNANNTCNLPYPPTAVKLTIFPTYDGYHKLHAKGFEFKFYAPPPTLANASIVEDGSALIVSFTRPVNLCNLSTCGCQDVLRNETMEQLGWDATCKWATTYQLVVFVHSHSLQDKITIMFKSGVLFEDNQFPAIPATEGLSILARQVSSNKEHQQLVAVTGPLEVPVCGLFHIQGHYSAILGGTANFSWAAGRQDGRPITNVNLKNALGTTRESTLTLESEWLEVGVWYLFLFTLVPTHGGPRASASANHTVVRKPYKGPIVTAFSSALLSSKPIMPNQEVYLIRELSVPECAAGPSPTLAVWTTNHPLVLFDFQKYLEPVYKIASNTLPEDNVVYFIAKAFLGNRINETTSSFVRLDVGHVPLMSFIRGNRVRTVGSAMHINSSLIRLKAHVEKSVIVPLRYKWTCMDQDQQPCYNYGSFSNSTLLLERENQTKDHVFFRSQQLKAGQELTFSLQVYHAQNPTIRSKVDTVLVKVVPGNIPQVVISKVSYRGIEVRQPTVTGVFYVPATAAVAIDALVLGYHGKDRKFGRWLWTVRGLPSQFLIASSDNKTHLLLPEGATVAHGVYQIELSICNGKMSICNNATVNLYAAPGVTGCKLFVEDYTELNMTSAHVFGCSISHDRSPVVYQLFLVTPRRKIAITGPQFTNVFSFAGPPDESGEGLVFIAQVCDKISVCSTYNSSLVRVKFSDDLNSSADALIAMANQSLLAGDPIRSLSLVGVAAMASNDSFLREKITDYVRDAIKSIPLLPGQVALMYSSLSSLFEDPNSDMIMKALDAIKGATLKAAALKRIPPMEAFREAYALTTKLIRYYPDNVALLAKVSDVHETLVSTLATTMPLAEVTELRPDEENGPVLFLYHTYFNTESFNLKYNPSSKVTDVTVKFSQGVRDKVNSEDCKNNPCHQVAAVFALFPGDSLFPEEEDERRVSPVITINLFSPRDGKELHINEKEGITMFLRQTANQTRLPGKVTKCHMWDEGLRAWTMEPVITLGSSEGRVRCVSSHEGIYAAIEVSLGLSGGAIAGIIVATLMFVTIMGMIVMFFLRQKKANKAAARASNSTQALKEGDQMNSSIYPA